MDGKKRYTQAEVDGIVERIKRDNSATILDQRERIDELKKQLAEAERKIVAYEKQKELVYKAITAALKKADDIERVSLIKYNQEIAQLKSFHEKWMSYYNRIIEQYPLDETLVETSRVNRKVSEVLLRAGDIDSQYEEERARLKESLESEEESEELATDEYSDRSPAGFSFTEALHPKEDLKDIMRELGVIMDEE